MTDLASYFRREAAIYRLPALMAKQREKNARTRSVAARKGWETRRAGA